MINFCYYNNKNALKKQQFMFNAEYLEFKFQIKQKGPNKQEEMKIALVNPTCLFHTANDLLTSHRR